MDDKEKAIRHLKKNHDQHSNYALCSNKADLQVYNSSMSGYENVSYKEVTHGACYAGISDRPSDYKWIALGYYCDKGDSAGKNFLNWIFGEKSPWRSLITEPLEIIQDDTHIYGFFIPESICKAANGKFLKNFMIASRTFNEFEEHMRLWDYLVQNGIPEDRAFFYSGRYVLHEGNPHYKLNQNTNHWAWDTDDPDFDAIQQSKPSIAGHYTNGIWKKPNTRIGSFGIEKNNKVFKEYHGGAKTTIEAMLKMDKDYVNGNFKLS